VSLLSPYVWLGALLALLGALGGGYWWGHSAAAASCAARAGKASAKIEQAEDRRDANIEAIATATGASVAAALSANRGSTDESTERIRTVVVPGACAAVDPDILRELRAARDDANAALGVGVRPASSGASASHP